MTTWVPFVPSPTTPLDSGLRRNDERGAELASAGAVGCWHPQGRLKPFLYQSLIPADAGTPGYENEVPCWQQLHAIRAVPKPPLWIPAFAGMANGEIRGTPGHYRSSISPILYQSLMPVGAGTPKYENEAPCPNHLGATPAGPHHPSGFRPRIGVRGSLFAGMTNGRSEWRLREPWNAGTLKVA